MKPVLGLLMDMQSYGADYDAYAAASKLCQPILYRVPEAWCNSPHGLVLTCFVWSETPQGTRYWSEVYQTLYNNFKMM